MEFIDAFSSAKEETFRLELLDRYLIDGEKESIAYWKAHGRPQKDPLLKEWNELLERVMNQGAITQRVHVVSLPLSDYIKYEIAAYKITKEDVGLISRSDYVNIKKPFEPKDFWLIDGRHLFLVNYDKDGRWRSFEHIKDRQEVDRYDELRRLLLSRSTPIKKFLEQNKDRL